MIILGCHFTRDQNIWDQICNTAEGMFPAPKIHGQAAYVTTFIGGEFERTTTNSVTDTFKTDGNEIKIDTDFSGKHTKKVLYTFRIDDYDFPKIELSECEISLINNTRSFHKMAHLRIQTDDLMLPPRKYALSDLDHVFHVMAKIDHTQMALSFVSEFLTRVRKILPKTKLNQIILTFDPNKRNLLSVPDDSNRGVQIVKPVIFEKMIEVCSNLSSDEYRQLLESVFSWIQKGDYVAVEIFINQFQQYLLSKTETLKIAQ